MAAACITSITFAGAAGADVPHASPPSLPTLDTTRAEAHVESAFATLEPYPGSARAHVMVNAVALEIPIFEPWIHLGWRYAAAAGESVEGRTPSSALISGNLTTSFRVSWFSGHGIAFSAGLLAAAPTAWFGRDGTSADVARAARSVRVDDRVAFTPKAFAISPVLDLRVDLALLTFQLRQTLDASIELSERATQSTTATTVVYGGIHLGDHVMPGVEITQIYVLDGSAPDDARSRYTLMPHVRYFGRKISPFLGIFYGTPALHPRAEQIWGLRLGFNVGF